MTVHVPRAVLTATRANLRNTLEDVREWIAERGFINGVHYDEASVLAEIDASIAQDTASNGSFKRAGEGEDES